MIDDRHEFGGPWTELKLDALQAYAEFFTTALQASDFDLWYIDAFAGTGARTTRTIVGGLFENEPISEIEEHLDGSAKRAIEVQPAFRHLVFIEERQNHHRALAALAKLHPSRDVRTIKGNANQILPEIFAAKPWRGDSKSWRQRAVVFLDPYGINVDFTTLKVIAETERADVWYLVNLKGVLQQLAHDHARLDDSKRRALTRFFGAEGWEDEFYAFQQSSTDLFSRSEGQVGNRKGNREDVAAFYRARLASIFRYVSSPLGLTVGTQQDYFQFYCLSNSSSVKALALIRRGAEAVVKKHRQASRRTSAPRAADQ